MRQPTYIWGCIQLRYSLPSDDDDYETHFTISSQNHSTSIKGEKIQNDCALCRTVVELDHIRRAHTVGTFVVGTSNELWCWVQRQFMSVVSVVRLEPNFHKISDRPTRPRLLKTEIQVHTLVSRYFSRLFLALIPNHKCTFMTPHFIRSSSLMI